MKLIVNVNNYHSSLVSHFASDANQRMEFSHFTRQQVHFQSNSSLSALSNPLKSPVRLGLTQFLVKWRELFSKWCHVFLSSMYSPWAHAKHLFTIRTRLETKSLEYSKQIWLIIKTVNVRRSVTAILIILIIFENHSNRKWSSSLPFTSWYRACSRCALSAPYSSLVGRVW